MIGFFSGVREAVDEDTLGGVGGLVGDPHEIVSPLLDGIGGREPGTSAELVPHERGKSLVGERLGVDDDALAFGIFEGFADLLVA